MSFSLRGSRVMRVFGMGLVMQALLSGANFAVGLILIRRTSDLQYSYYVLATNTLLLLTALQTSFIQPYIVRNLTVLDAGQRHDLVGALIRTNRRWVPLTCGAGVLITACLWLLHQLDLAQALLIVAALAAAGGALSREFFRLILFAYRQPASVLRADTVFVVVLIAGSLAATLFTQTALVAVCGLGLANLAGFLILGRSLWRYEAWNRATTDNVMGKIAAAGAWAILGSGIHWLLIQGYSYLVAGILDVSAIATIAATRLTLMPVFVLSGGVSMLLFPMTSRWVHDLGARAASQRLSLLVAGLLLAAVCYMTCMWEIRDWIFTVILKKQFAHRDSLLLLWSAVFLVTLCRDQLATLPAARARFKEMTLATACSAVAWLISSYFAMARFGPPGAVMGILVGESLNMAAILAMIVRENRSNHGLTAAV
jgi:O-antigen/teichoic acid export membrane protein